MQNSKRHVFDSFLNSASKSFMITDEMIELDKLVEHPMNDEIYPKIQYEYLPQAFLDDIREYGVLQSIEVRRLSGNQYQIIGGHRRVAALKEIYAITKEDRHNVVKAHVFEDMSDFDALDRLILSNSYREKTEYSKLKEIEVLQANIIERKNAGEPLKGSVRSLIASAVKMSETQVGKYQKIIKDAIPEVKEKVSKGELTIGQAITMSSSSKKEQEKSLKSNDNVVSDSRITVDLGLEHKKKADRIAKEHFNGNVTEMIKSMIEKYSLED